jgi:hypothetical protein
MSSITRGFRGRRQLDAPAGRIPPGQYVTPDFPLLSAGPTPRIPLENWRFTMTDPLGSERSWTWADFTALPTETVTVDIHCVTKWSKLDTTWEGVSLDTLLADGTDRAGGHVLFHSYGGYTTNLPLEDVTGGKAWIAFNYDGQPLDPEHGGPARLLVPISTSGRAPSGWTGRRSPIPTVPASGSRTDITTMGTHGGSSATRETELADRQSNGDYRRDRTSAKHRPRLPRLAGPPLRAPHRHTTDWRRRLSGATQLLDRQACRR